MCTICGSPEESLPHFGGFSCRACAAFFRRYYLSKKKYISCTCPKRKENSHPCRHCRIVKCLNSGMSMSKIQPSRDSVKEITDVFQPIGTLLTHRQIVARDSPNLSSTVSYWPSYAQKRMELYGGNVDDFNIYGVTSCIRKDCNLTWQMISTIFPQINAISEVDRNALMRNFVPKWWQLEPAIDFTANQKMWKIKGYSVEKAISQFYSTHLQQKSTFETVQIFKPFWLFYYNIIIYPIAQKNFDTVEFMALILLLFFDFGHPNLSDECAKVCENIRKVVLRELRNYQSQDEENLEEPMRFFETIETLTLIDKGEKKFEDEMLLCEMHKVRIHDEFKTMILDVRNNN